MDLLFQLKGEVDKLKEAVEFLKTQSVEKICAQVLEGFHDRLARLEERVRGLEIVHAIDDESIKAIEDEAGN